MSPRWLILLCLFVGAGLVWSDGEPAKPQVAVDFTHQIRPILSENCFACHGPDEKQRKAKLRLDTKEGTFAALKGGGHAITPGKPGESELVKRITSSDPDAHMPPLTSGKKLTPAQIELVRKWIEQGAKWNEHWAFTAPVRPNIPVSRDAQRSVPVNPIDAFVLSRLQKEGLTPNSAADRPTLIRRVTLDLTGLPPTMAEVDAFLADTSPNAYEKVVDRLLAAPRFGEHLARFWLDAARYGDTHGLHLDNYREMWPYREWVIKALNANMPFKQFVIEQLAGDLLPNATLEQQVASGFNRCNVTTSEGGSITEEVYVRNVVDRVDTTGVVFLGLSTGCARCHDHKFDPLTTKEYYQLFAFFNSLDDNPLDGNAAQHPPVVKVPSAEQKTQMDGFQQQIAGIQAKVADEVKKVKYDETLDANESEVVQRADFVWFEDALPAGAKPTVGGMNAEWNYVTKPEHPVFSGVKAVMRTAEALSQFVYQDANPALKVGEGDTLFAYVFIDPLNPPKEIMLQWRTTDWLHRAYWGENLIDFGKNGTSERLPMGALPKSGKWLRLEVDAAKVGIKPGTMINGLAFTQHGGRVFWDHAGMETWTNQEGQIAENLTAWVRQMKAGGLAKLPKPLQDIINIDRPKRTPEQKKQLIDHYIATAYPKTKELLAPLQKQIAEIEQKRTQLDKQIPTTYISSERKEPKPSFILNRGEYDQRKDEVKRGLPGFLPPMPRDAPVNRLGFAQWLVSREHPLTARVAVNRLWQQCFGAGLVKTAEDFGSQGEPPSHPELLDWLAVQFMDDGWDVKKFMKMLVMASTYQQSSRLTSEKLAKDPANRLLSRGARFRLDAEMLRDQALVVSGLLVEKLGGPSVKPPQPAGLWEAVGYVSSNTRNFVADTGHEKVHRRSLYTFWKRTAPPPQMNAFDAPSRESCLVRRERTNTPLQALLLLNETQNTECARVLAERTLREASGDVEARLVHMFRLVTARRPDARELAELKSLFNDHLAEYTRDPEGAKKLIAVGETKSDPAFNPTELAAWTMVANLIFNLDEVVNK